MCGILAYTHGIAGVEIARADIQRRGPNHYDYVDLQGFVVEAAVLALRNPFTKQPIKEGGNIVAFNGQIYDHVGANENDASWFAKRCTDLPKLLSEVDGEFAFVCVDKDGIVWFGRDHIGRRSLVYRCEGENIIIASLAPDCQECEAGVLYSWHPSFGLRKTKIDFQYPPTDLKLKDALRGAIEKRCILPSGLDKVAVLFSGGLDCTLIAYFLCCILPETISIHLVNVAFENRRAGSLYVTPDRLLGQRSLNELTQLFPNRALILDEVNVPYEEATNARPLVRHLIDPAATVMDLDIALAFYFAAAAPTTGPILFSGLGADELFGGYSRHLRAARQDRLVQELDMDFSRLGSRNLGRDDRVCCNDGKEVRYPYLDAEVVSVARNLPPEQKCDGEKTKIALREVGKSLGLKAVISEKKRAIQFGSRSAKMDPGSGRAKGNDALNA